MFNKKKILFIVDVEGWAYDDQAKNWKSKLEDEFEIEILYLADFPTYSINILSAEEPLRAAGLSTVRFGALEKKLISTLNRNVLNKKIKKSWLSNYSFYLSPGGYPDSVFDHEKYNLILFFYSNAIFDSRLSGTVIPSEKVLICINNEKWEDNGAKAFVGETKNFCKGFICCNDYILKEFSRFSESVYKASQLVNSNVFFPVNRKPFDKNNFTVGYSGSTSNSYKNFDLIKSSAAKAGVTLSVAQDLTREELNAWYSNVDAIICASKSEGGPMCILEAGITKTPVITARVGLCREFANDANAYIIEKTEESIISAINEVKNNYLQAQLKSEILYNVIRSNYTYSTKSDDMRCAIREALASVDQRSLV